MRFCCERFGKASPPRARRVQGIWIHRNMKWLAAKGTSFSDRTALSHDGRSMYAPAKSVCVCVGMLQQLHPVLWTLADRHRSSTASGSALYPSLASSSTHLGQCPARYTGSAKIRTAVQPSQGSAQQFLRPAKLRTCSFAQARTDWLSSHNQIILSRMQLRAARVFRVTVSGHSGQLCHEAVPAPSHS